MFHNHNYYYAICMYSFCIYLSITYVYYNTFITGTTWSSDELSCCSAKANMQSAVAHPLLAEQASANVAGPFPLDPWKRQSSSIVPGHPDDCHLL